MISGDIAEATSIELILKEMASTIQKPIYFVLGNHDYYRGSINDLRSTVISITKDAILILATRIRATKA